MSYKRDLLYMNLALKISECGTCVRKKVGAVLVKKCVILSTGTNSITPGMNICTKETCIRNKLNVPSGKQHELCLAIHAEQQAILKCFNKNIDVKDSTLYVTHSPCLICAKIIAFCGIREVIYNKKYPDDLAFEVLKKAGILVESLEERKERYK